MKIVCLTGMHRSGTSLVSRVVNLLGVDLGPPEELMPPKPDNPRGFWENSAISAVNDDLLAALGGRWDDPPVLADGWEDKTDLDPLRTRGAQIIERLQSRPDAGPALAWKDPRNSLLFPFWRTVTPIDATILTVRHPSHVAASLAKRDGLDSETSAYLWLRYLASAWRSEPKRLTIRFNDLFTDLDQQVERIVEYLGVPAPDDATRKAIAQFVEPELRHHTSAPTDNGPTMALAVALFDLFETSPAALDPIVEALNRLWLAETEVEGLRVERDVAARHRDELLEERKVAVARGEELDRTLLEVAGERDRLKQEHGELAAEASRLRDAGARAAHLEARLKTQVEAIEQAERVALALRAEVAQKDARIRDLDRRVQDLDVSMKRWRIERIERVLRRFRLL